MTHDAPTAQPTPPGHPVQPAAQSVQPPTPPVQQPTPPVQQPTPPVQQPAPPVQQPAPPVQQPADPAADLHARAISRLKKKRDFAAHVLIYTLVNGFFVIIWALTSHGFFWPVFPMLGWGIGLVMNAWDVWRGSEFTEEQVAREMARQKRRESP